MTIKRLFTKLTLLAAGLSLLLTVNVNAEELTPEAFEAPAKPYLPKTWMHGMNGNLSKPGFSEDFKAMKEAGIGGAIFFHVHRRNVPLSSTGPVRFGTDEFFDTIVHAAGEADKNGIEFGVHNSDGWSSSGGPWVTPEMSMKRVTWSEQTVTASATGQTFMPPQPTYEEGFYRDIAVLALPANKYSNDNLFANGKITSSQTKLDLNLLTDKNRDSEYIFAESDSKQYWLQVEVAQPTTLRSLQIETPTRKGAASLQVSNDGVNFTTVAEKLSKPRIGADMWAFSPQLVDNQNDGFTGKYFRIVFEKPTSIKRFELWSEPRFSHWLAMNNMHRGRLSLTPKTKDDAIIKASEVVVLNRGELPAQGINLPKGKWQILRFGYTSTGAVNRPASLEGEGLEVDKFDPKALEFHFEKYVGRLAREAKAKGIKSLKTSEIDSYEVGGQNWTQGFEASFKEKFGYDLVKWLPLYTGRVIESSAHSGAIMQEVRQHQSDLMVENYFAEFTRLLKKYDMESYIEPYGAGPFDELAAGGTADRLMGEFWVRDQVFNGRVMAAISSAHIYGKKIVSAESFTSGGAINWKGHPYFFKHYGDKLWARGINETMFHRFAHQPNNHIKPGMTMDSVGSHIDRTQTWWQNGGVAWFDYLARGSYLLQQGVPDADVLVHLGDVAPLRVGNANNTKVPLGYGYDYTNTDVLLNRVSVKDGYLVLPEGTRYRVLHLVRTDYMHLKTLKRIKELVAAGATVIGAKPKQVIGFSEWSQQDEFNRISDQLWGAKSSKSTLRTYQRGLVSSFGLMETLNRLDIEPSLKINQEPVMFFAKRRIGDNDLYYFYNDKPEFQQLEVDIRDGDGQPEIWNADDGSIERIKNFQRQDQRLTTTLALEPYASRFVVIRRDNQKPNYNGQHSQLVKDVYLNGITTKTLTEAWNVNFDPLWAGPGQVVFKQLTDWTKHADSGVKHYSGTAVYTRMLNIDKQLLTSGKPLYLDLGHVEQIAEVSVNGKPLATLWKPPFAVDISKAATAGANKVEVKVTNTWVNRLIGDEYLPDTSGYSTVGDTVPWLTDNLAPPKSDRVTFTGFNFYKQEKRRKLQSSGLLGPVRLISTNP